MIASIDGVVEDKLSDRTIVSLNGLGYEIFVLDNTLLSLDKGNRAKLFIHEQIKEDAHDLYGFESMNEKQLFDKLLSVKNVGPRVAMAVLNIGPVDSLKRAIVSGDAKLLQSAKGVGRRAAEQIIVELRDKLGLVSTIEAEAIVSRSGAGESDEATEALIALGFSPYDAHTALTGIDKDLPVEQRIKQALRVSR